MVDIVRSTTPLTQLDEVTEDLDKVFLGEDSDMRRGLQTQTFVDLVAAHTAQIVSFRIEEDVLDRRPRGLHVRRVAGPQQRVDGGERLFFTVGGILLQGVLDDRTLSSGLLLARVDLHLLSAIPFQELGHVLIDLRGFLDQHLTRLTVDDLFCQDAPEDLLVALFIQGHGIDHLGREEELIDVRIRSVPEGPQEGRCRELLLLVDVDITDVVDVDAEFDPRAPERNDTGTVKLRAVRMDVLLEDHTRRTMQLAHHDPLGTVDDERAQLGEERQIAEIDFFLDDISRTLFPLFPLLPLAVLFRTLPHDQPQQRLQGCRVGHVPFDALFDRVLRLTERRRYVLESEVLVDVGDRKNFCENAIEAKIPLFLHIDILLDELLERPELDVQKIGHRHDRLELRKAHNRTGIFPNIQGCSPLPARAPKGEPNKHMVDDYGNGPPSNTRALPQTHTG